MVLIKKDGCEVLTSAPKELIEIWFLYLNLGQD
jgi:hypothetical protein